MGSFSIWHWLVVLVIVALIFGTKTAQHRVRPGRRGQGFKEGMKDANGGDKPAEPIAQQRVSGETIDVQTRKSPIPEPSRLSLRAAPSARQLSFRAAIACLMSASLN